MVDENIEKEFEKAKEELGVEVFNEHLWTVFGKPCLNFVKTIVINLPGTCYANCSYCIDNPIRSHVTDPQTFLDVCQKVFEEFSDIKEVSITGGSLNAVHFNSLIHMILEYYPSVKITWNTNGINIDKKHDVKNIQYINLHRNSVDEEENKKVFCTKFNPLSLKEAKKLFGEKLCLRVTIDENFDLEKYIDLGIPLYLNQMLPGNEMTMKKYEEVLDKLDLQSNDFRRRNVYLNTMYKNVPVRVCVGDRLATHVAGRYPTFLNVAIIHRSGVVCGSWYEDDKVLYLPDESRTKKV